MSSNLAKKDSYHHGDLRQALIDAAYDIIAEQGPDEFSMADACRRAGVSTAAPYRHFSGREELISEVVLKALQNLDQHGRSKRDEYELGTIDSIRALGQAYVSFALANPRIFKLMFSKTATCDPPDQNFERQAPQGFAKVTESVDAFREKNGLMHLETMPIALALWSLVHGIASLQIDGDFDVMAPGIDVYDLVETGGRNFLEGLIARHQHPDSH